MPGLNGTGPQGAGPMTGGGRGLCNPTGSVYGRQALGNTGGFNRGMGGGFGRSFRNGNGMGIQRGFNRGRGMGFMANQGALQGLYPVNDDEELNILKAQANSAQSTLNAINKRIAELQQSSD